MKKEYVIGIDLGGTKVEACLLDSSRKLVNRCRESSEASRGLEHVVKKIIEVVHKAAEGRIFTAVGMGTPGTFIASDDKLYGSPHTPVYESPGFIQKIRDKLSVPLLVENDANYARAAKAYLPRLEFSGISDPVVQVIDESNQEIVYTLRVLGKSYLPKVFKPGLYTLKIGEPGTINMKILNNINTLTKNEWKTLVVKF